MLCPLNVWSHVALKVQPAYTRLLAPDRLNESVLNQTLPRQSEHQGDKNTGPNSHKGDQQSILEPRFKIQGFVQEISNITHTAKSTTTM